MGQGDLHDDDPVGNPHDDLSDDLSDDGHADGLDDDLDDGAHDEPPRGRSRGGGALPDPLDRVWVHPTELAGFVAARGGSGAQGSEVRPRAVTWLAPVVAGAAGAVLTIVILSVTGALDAAKTPAGPVVPLRQTTSSLAAVPDALARLGPSVVAVVATDARGTRRGSAVCIRHGAQLLTSARVVGDADQVEVLAPSGRSSAARVAGRDLVTDLVLLDLPSNADVPAAQLAERPPASGTAVWLLGAPPPGATSGWTSDGKAFSNDAMVADTRTGPTTAGLVETDAASTDSARGGALVDGSGKVAGIVLGRVNARATTKTYAVRIDVAIGVAQQLDANGAAEHGSLGMRGVDTKFGPMVVAMAKDTPAAQAGMRVHDLVTTVDGHAVRTIGEMTAVVRSLPPGRHVVIALRREGRAMEIRAKLGATTAPTATAVTTVAATVRAGG